MPKQNRHAKVDPIEQDIELVLSPGVFIPDRACFSFVTDLDEVAAKIAKLTAGNPSRAVILYETFLAACYAKIEEFDDSSGSFGQFVDDLYCGWIKARQAEGANPDETASRLLTWMDDDDYGFCYQLEKDAAKVLDKANLAAFVLQVRARFDAAASAAPKTDGTIDDRPDHIRRRYGEILRTLYAAQKDVAAYVALAEETGLSAQDCHAIATLLVTRRKSEEALSWVERGIDLDKKTPHGSMAGHDLADLMRQTKDHALECLSHYATEPVAEKIEKAHPDLAARLWRAQGLRIVNGKKSKYYDAALSNFDRAKHCFERAGLAAEWQKTVSQVRVDHHRKSGFMSGFERLAAGSGLREEPSFLDRAKARWSRRQGGVG